QAKKGGSRRHGAKALDPAVAAAKDGEDQEQLAALAPSSALRAPSPAGGRRASRSICGKRRRSDRLAFPRRENLQDHSVAGTSAGGASHRASRLPANSATSSSVNPPQNVE